MGLTGHSHKAGVRHTRQGGPVTRFSSNPDVQIHWQQTGIRKIRAVRDNMRVLLLLLYVFSTVQSEAVVDTIGLHPGDHFKDGIIDCTAALGPGESYDEDCEDDQNAFYMDIIKIAVIVALGVICALCWPTIFFYIGCKVTECSCKLCLSGLWSMVKKCCGMCCVLVKSAFNQKSAVHQAIPMDEVISLDEDPDHEFIF